MVIAGGYSCRGLGNIVSSSYGLLYYAIYQKFICLLFICKCNILSVNLNFFAAEEAVAYYEFKLLSLPDLCNIDLCVIIKFYKFLETGLETVELGVTV